ncbi:hypothetical protein [Xylanimonas oleitrophica]|uniref:hypothetical protein n=1 Tax=Xylanimonas oleitrophica TaxID=2607479 RepID=UPI0015D0182D|nr:hypothetical protein [Xylanimonas oleitrophica]
MSARIETAAALDAWVSEHQFDHFDAYEEVVGSCVLVSDLRAALAPLLAEAEERGAREALDWAAEHLTDGMTYEDVAALNSWAAIVAAQGVIRARAVQIGGDQ